MVLEKFSIYGATITANTFVVSQQIESPYFDSCPPSKTLSRVFIIIPQADGNCPFIAKSVF